VETTGLDPRLDLLRIVSINGEAFDTWNDADRDTVLQLLDDHKEHTFVAHNAQFDLEFLEEHLGYVHEGPVFDTMVAWQILQNGRNISASLDSVSRLLLKRTLSKEFQKGPWDALMDNQMLDYAAEDTAILPDLHTKLADALSKAKLAQIMSLEMLLLPILVKARRKGILFDLDAARQLQEELRGKASTLESGLPDNLNPRSPQQVTRYFNLPNSSVDTLRDHYKMIKNNPGKDAGYLHTVMEIRKIMKKISTIQKQLIGHMRYDGRIHPSFTQCFTETGRLSSRNPNLQNQDRGDDIRSLFVPAEGCKFVIADYSSLEVRIAAMLAGEDAMLKVLWDGRDLHSETCARIFGEETKQTRTLSKNILFGSLFGGGHNTVIRFAAKSGVDLDEKEARQFQKQLFEAYPKLKAWHHKAGDTSKQYVYSLQGRRRYISKGDGYCTRINHPVQSSAADGQKLSIIELSRLGYNVVGNVHDELLIEIPSERAEDALSDVERVMVGCMYRATRQDPLKPVVPIAVEGGIANDWSEKK
jgi:DNA polymerase I-like protein with 3'-5' exonuclease and polymerase domains